MTMSTEHRGIALLDACRPLRRELVIAVTWSFAAGAPAFVSGLAVAQAADAVRDGRITTAVWWLALIAVSISVGAVATRTSYCALAVAVEGTRDRMMAAVVQGSLAALASTERRGTAGLTQLVDQTDQVRNLLSAMSRGFRSTVIPLVAAIVGLLALDIRLGFVVAVPIALAIWLYAALLPRTIEAQRTASQAGETLGGFAGTALSDVAGIRGIGAVDWVAAAIVDKARATGRADLVAARVVAARHCVIAIGGYLPLLTVLLVAAPMTHNGQLSSGELIGATTYVLIALVPALSVAVTGHGAWLIQLFVLLDRLAIVADVPDPVKSVTARQC